MGNLRRFFACTLHAHTDKLGDHVQLSFTATPLEGFQKDHVITTWTWDHSRHLQDEIEQACQEHMATLPANGSDECVESEFYLWDEAEHAWGYYWSSPETGNWYSNLEFYETGDLT